MEKSYKFRIYPNKKQKELIQKTFGCVRFVYNYYLNKRIEAYRDNKETLNYYVCSKDLTLLKQEKEWLREPDKYSLQKTLKDLDVAYKNFFEGRASYPKFKSRKNRYRSYRTSFSNGNIKFLTKHIQLPKLGKVRVRDKYIPSGRILNATVSQEPNGHYYVSLCCTDVVVNHLPKTRESIGIDLGIISFATLSNGSVIPNQRFYEKSEAKLVKLQKELSRKPIGGSNWEKARLRVAKLQKHIAEQRRDFLQKLTTELVKNYDVICVEDLDVESMKETDSKIRNKRVGDVSFAEFRRMLGYKCKWYGKELVVVDRYFASSQICHVCGKNDGKKSVQIRHWKCKQCGSKLDRDLNAAQNILNEGMRILSKAS